MTYDELTKRLAVHRYTTRNFAGGETLVVPMGGERAAVRIDESQPFIVTPKLPGWGLLSYDEQYMVMDIANEYAATPIKARELDPVHFNVRLVSPEFKATGSNLIQHPNGNLSWVVMTRDKFNHKTQFTNGEIEVLPEAVRRMIDHGIAELVRVDS